MEKHIGSEWQAEKELIITRICGDVTTGDVEEWERSLLQALDQVKDNGRFKIFVNMHGFKAVDITAHKRFRAIIPLTLADYGWKTGYIDLFEEAADQISYSNKRGITCIAAAHAHMDQTKMDLYQNSYSRSNEHFFTDPLAAREWIEQLKP